MASRRQRRQRQPSGQFVDLFKGCGVTADALQRGGDFRRAGDISLNSVDRAIGRPVVRLAGAVPAANSLRLPRKPEASLGTQHRFLYVQLRLEPGKTYALHADFTTADRGQHRLSISNLWGGEEGARARARRAGSLHVYLPAAHADWTLLAIDLQSVAAAAGAGVGGGGGGSPFARLRTLQLCANMTVRGAFTSDVAYDWHSLPADLAFSASFDVGQARVLWVPAEPTGGVQVAAPRLRSTSPRPAVPAHQPALQRPKSARLKKNVLNSELEQPLALQPAPIATLQRVAAFSGQHAGLLHWVPPGSGLAGSNADCLHEVVYAACSIIVVMKLPEAQQQQQQQQQQQRHLRGHLGSVRALALSADGGRLASAEEGPGSTLRLWDLRQGVCLSTVPGHAGGTICLDLSPDGSLLATAGVDSQGRQELACWDVSACWVAVASDASGAALPGCIRSSTGSGGSSGVASRARELARQVSDYKIQAIKCVPHDPSRLVTCGKNSVRVHRLKDGQLRSLSVPMDGVVAACRPYSCGTLASPASSTVGEVFCCLAFEPPLRERPLAVRRMLAGTSSGALYAINLETRAVEGVSQAHSSTLAALAVHEGFCVTGGADCLLRLWGSDMREAYMEAAHEGAVTGVALSPDGLRVVVGTSSGAMSLLDVPSAKYSTLLRSHTAEVHAVALLAAAEEATGLQQQPAEAQYCTAGADGTVRVWSSADHQQVLELSAPGETVLSIACHPSKLEVACAFQGGSLRVFDASTAALVAQSRQHTGAVTQLVYAQQGHVLYSLGEDGCVCAYNTQRAYMPNTFVLAGFPLHATVMATNAHGKLLATAALCLGPGGSITTGSGLPASSAARGSTSSGGSAATQPTSAIVLYNTVSLQPELQLPVAGRSRVVQLQLLPDSRHVLALTADGRLLAYSCADGSTVLDIPRCLPSPCLASALDPSGSFLVAGTASGQIKVWGLRGLHSLLTEQCGSGSGSCGAATTSPQQQQQQQERLATASAGIMRSLPCQEFSAPAGSAVAGAVFLSSRQLLTVGSQGEVCCWSFHGEPCFGCTASTDVATAGTLVVTRGQQTSCTVAGKPLQQLQPVSVPPKPQHRPAIGLSADCTGQTHAPLLTPLAPPRPGSSVTTHALGLEQEQQPPLLQQAALAGAADADSPAPRPLPAALQRCLPPRPPSAPPALQPKHGTAAAVTCAAAAGRQESSSLPATPVRGRNKEPPIWERYQKAPEASLLITATPGERCTQVVRQQTQLRVSSPGKRSSGAKQRQGEQLQRSAEWVDGEVHGDRVPAYRPGQQLQLLPPTAAVQRVCGFDATAGFQWQPLGCPHQLLYAAGNVLVLEDLPAWQQRHLARLPRDITAVAASGDGRLAAAAVRPASAEGSSAEIHLVGLQGPLGGTTVLSHHSFAVKTVVFSPDSSLLASLSHSPDSTACTLALWSVGEPEPELVAAVELSHAVSGLAWAAHADGGAPTFYTASSQGLLQWQLEPDSLSSSAVHLPAGLRGAALTAVETCVGEAISEEGDAAHSAAAARLAAHEKSSAGGGCSRSSGTVYVGDGGGRVWRLEMDSGQYVKRSQLLAEVQGQAVSCLRSGGTHLLAAGTSSGGLLLLAEESWSDREASWRMVCGEELDGAVVGLQLDRASRGVVAATACGTLWRAGPGNVGTAPEVLLCGQQRGLSGWQLAVGAAWKGVPPTVAMASHAGVAVWQMGEASASGRAPLVEFSQLAGATHVSLAGDASCCAAAYADGTICLYDVAGARLHWRATGAADQGGVVALQVVQRLRGCKVMVAYRSGALLVLDGGSGQVAHRTLQFAVQQDSGRVCPSNFPLTSLAVHHADSAVFALCGHQALVVCKAAWTKNAAVTPLARLSFGSTDSINVGSQEQPCTEAAAALAVQAVFCHAHPGHIYCSDPTAPGQLVLFDYTAQMVVKTLLAPLADGAGITALALDQSETLLAAGTSAGTVLLLRLESESWAELAAHAEGTPLMGMAFSACGKRLFSAAAGACATLVWELGH